MLAQRFNLSERHTHLMSRYGEVCLQCQLYTIQGPLTPSEYKDALKEAVLRKLRVQYKKSAASEALLVAQPMLLPSVKEKTVEVDAKEEREAEVSCPVITQERSEVARQALYIDEFIEQEDSSLTAPLLLSNAGKKTNWRMIIDDLRQDPEFQAMIINQILQICEERIQLCQSFIDYAKNPDTYTADLEKEIVGEFKYLKNKNHNPNLRIDIIDKSTTYLGFYSDYLTLLRKDYKEEHLFDTLYYELKWGNYESADSLTSLESPKISKLLQPFLSSGCQERDKILSELAATDPTSFNAMFIINVAYANEPLQLLEEIKKKVNMSKLESQYLKTVEKFVAEMSVRLEKQIAECQAQLDNHVEKLSAHKYRTLKDGRLGFEEGMELLSIIEKSFNKLHSLKQEIDEFSRKDLKELIHLSEIAEKQKQLEVRRVLAKERAQFQGQAQGQAQAREYSSIKPSVEAVQLSVAELSKAEPSSLKEQVRQTVALSLNHAVEGSDLELEAEYQALLIYKDQKKEEMRDYKEKVRQERELKKAQLQERTRILRETLNFAGDEKESGELAAIHREQLEYLVRVLNKNQRTVLAKIFKALDFAEENISRKDKPKFSEVENLITALGGSILEDAHFGFLLPNIRKDWGQKISAAHAEGRYELTRKHMSRYVSCHPHGKQHNSDELSGFAIACIKGGLEKAGISPANIMQLESAKKVKKISCF